MTKNLNLAGDTAPSADDTDVEISYIQNLATGRGLTRSGMTIVLLNSFQTGFDADNSYVYNTGNNTDNCSNPGCYSYYSWDAATLGSSRSISTNNQNAPYSICPKGWKIPTTYDGSGASATATDYRALFVAYSNTTTQTFSPSTNPNGATMYGLIGPGTTPNYLLAGRYYNGTFYIGGQYGLYWTASSNSSTANARILNVDPTWALAADSSPRKYGTPVRCLYKGS